MPNFVLKAALIGAIAAMTVAPLHAQSGATLDCEDPANQEADECLGLPVGGRQITNFVPLVAPAFVLGILAAAGARPTTSTPNTGNNGNNGNN